METKIEIDNHNNEVIRRFLKNEDSFDKEI